MRKREGRSNRQHPQGGGFSFLEAMIAVMVLGIFIVPLSRLLSQGTAGTIQNREEIAAQTMAGELAAVIRTLPFDSPYLAPTGPDGKDITGGPVDLTPPAASADQARFRRRLYIEPPVALDEVPYPVRVITIEIAWVSEGVSNRLNCPVLMSGGADP